MRSTRVAKTAPKAVATAAGPDLPGAMGRRDPGAMAIALDKTGADLPIGRPEGNGRVEQGRDAKANSIAVVPSAAQCESAGSLRLLCRN